MRLNAVATRWVERRRVPPDGGAVRLGERHPDETAFERPVRAHANEAPDVVDVVGRHARLGVLPLVRDRVDPRPAPADLTERKRLIFDDGCEKQILPTLFGCGFPA